MTGMLIWRNSRHFLVNLTQKTDDKIDHFSVYRLYRVDHKFGNPLFVDWESADGGSETILSSNERYIQKLQNDTNFALVLWATLVLADI